MINIKIAKAGGLYHAKKIAAVAEAAGHAARGRQAVDLAPPFSDGYLDVSLGSVFGVTLDEQRIRTLELPKRD